MTKIYTVPGMPVPNPVFEYVHHPEDADIIMIPLTDARLEQLRKLYPMFRFHYTSATMSYLIDFAIKHRKVLIKTDDVLMSLKEYRRDH